jgi:hypothetical protein
MKIDIDSIIPKPNTIQTPITKSKNEYIQLLKSMIDAEVVPINRVILSSKLFDVTNNIETLTLFIKCMEEYQDKVGINSLVNGDKWCLCILRWIEAYEAKKAPKIIADSTNEIAGNYIDKNILLKYAA